MIVPKCQAIIISCLDVNVAISNGAFSSKQEINFAVKIIAIATMRQASAEA